MCCLQVKAFEAADAPPPVVKPGAKPIDGPSGSRPALLEAVQQELGVMQDDDPREGGGGGDSQAVGGEGQQRKRRRLLTTSTGVPLYTKPLPGQLGGPYAFCVCCWCWCGWLLGGACCWLLTALRAMQACAALVWDSRRCRCDPRAAPLPCVCRHAGGDGTQPRQALRRQLPRGLP